ncbi:MAG: hypothetical protein EAZ81_05815 [Verrucomicrobia bacterium]|nr:MAG: hypothetical protein EAZ81_05815 [Verrucomicrobiota bacterium]
MQELLSPHFLSSFDDKIYDDGLAFLPSEASDEADSLVVLVRDGSMRAGAKRSSQASAPCTSAAI